MYELNVLMMILIEKCIENWEEIDCQWSGINASITNKIGLVYV